jgi:hypothetical protein
MKLAMLSFLVIYGLIVFLLIQLKPIKPKIYEITIIRESNEKVQ